MKLTSFSHLFFLVNLFVTTAYASQLRKLQYNAIEDTRHKGNKIICSSLPSIVKNTAPSGAKMRLYGTCRSTNVAPISAENGFFMSGLCELFNNTARTSNIGQFRYTLDSIFDSSNLIQTFSVMRLFDQIVITSSASSFPYPTPGGLAPYLYPPVTFAVLNVMVDVGFAGNSANNCGLDKYKKFVYTDDSNGAETLVNFTFF